MNEQVLFALMCPSQVVVLPSGERGLVKNITTEMSDYDYALAGEHSTLLLNGVDITKVTTGSFLCDPTNPIPVVTNFQSRSVWCHLVL